MIENIPEEFRKDLYLNKQFDNVYVPKRYAERIVSHVVAHYLPDNHYFTPPLYLAITGDPGEGKTMQALAACNQRGIMVKYLSASRLSGEMEGDSRVVIEKVYDQAAKLRGLGFYVCILLDDFHLGNSNLHSENSRTVNAELLVGYMMNLAESAKQEQIPILLTGNDFSGTYEALMRDGRADIFPWEPTLEEKKAVVQTILRPIIQEKEWGKLDRFIERNANLNIAFFSQLKTDLRRKLLIEAIDDGTQINAYSLERIAAHITDHLRQLELSQVEALASERIESRKRGGV